MAYPEAAPPMPRRPRAPNALANLRSQVVVCERCAVADRWPGRLKGLLGRANLPRGEGLLLRPAPAVHTWFMRFPVDAVFLDREMTVVAIARNMGPWRGAARGDAKAVLELASGECERRGVAVGDRLALLERGSDLRSPPGRGRRAR